MKVSVSKGDIFIAAVLIGGNGKKRVMLARTTESMLEDTKVDFMEKIMLQCAEDHAKVEDMQVVRCREGKDIDFNSFISQKKQ